MANIVVFVELRAGGPTGPSRCALGEARRLADSLGATVYALAGLGTSDPSAADALEGPLGLAGADKILVCLDPALAGPPVDALWGGLLAAVAGQLRPRLFVFPAGSMGGALAAALAVRAGAAFMPRASLTLEKTGANAGFALVLRRFRGSPGEQRAYVLDAAAPAAVATVAAGPVPERPVGGPAELQVLTLPPGGPALVEEVDSEPDPDDAVESAVAVVVVPPGESDKAMAALREAVPANVAVVRAPASSLAAACPGLALVAWPRPEPQALAGLRTTPDTPVVVAGGRASKTKLATATHVWRVDKARAIAQAKAAFRSVSPGPREEEG